MHQKGEPRTISVVGSLNMDLFIEASRLPQPGETVLGTKFRRTPGGKGANQAVAVARMGAKGVIIGAVGADSFGEEIVAQLASTEVMTEAIIRRSQTSTGTALIVVDRSGQNQIVVAPGANALLSPQDVKRHQKLIRRSHAVIAQLEVPIKTVEAALRLGREAKILTVLNPAPSAPLTRRLLSFCDWIVPNESEAEKLTGIRIASLGSAASAARMIARTSGNGSVAITLGPRGVWLHTPAFVGLVPGFAVRAIDAVGAGDTFTGAFTARLVEGATPRDAAYFACAAAAIAVTRRGAQSAIPSRREVNALLV
jgi:ribokinase